MDHGPTTLPTEDAAKCAQLADLQSGRASSFEALVREHGGRLLAVTRRLLAHEEDAREALQDAFLAAFRAIEHFDGRSQLSTWLHRIAVNSALQKLRTRKRKPSHTIDELLPTFLDDGHQTHSARAWQATVVQAIERQETRQIVQQAIGELPDAYRTVLVLRDVAAKDSKDNATVTSAGFVDLGVLKGNIGDQNYPVPADVDLSKYESVTVWCSRFGVNFATAPLNPAAAPAPVSLAMGQFHGVAHESKGKATVHQLPGGQRVLRFTDFQTSNGPALKVYLIAAQDANDSDTVAKARFVDLGSLKGNVGDQKYDVPTDVDLSQYRAVSVWCSSFNVNFATVPLTSRN